MDGIAAIEARIQAIKSQFGLTPAAGVLGASSINLTGGPTSTSAGLGTGTGTTDTTSFADALASAQGAAGTLTTDPTVPTTTGEGTKASFNPLATTRSGFAGEIKFNSVGVKDYATFQKRHRRQRARADERALRQHPFGPAGREQCDGGCAGDRELPLGHGRRSVTRAQVSRGVALRGRREDRLAVGHRLPQYLLDGQHLVDASRDLTAERE